MDIQLLTMLGLHIARELFGRDGKNSKEVLVIGALIRGFQAGRNMDAGMKRYAAIMGTGDEPSMDELISDLNRETDEFLSRGSDGQLPA